MTPTQPHERSIRTLGRRRAWLLALLLALGCSTGAAAPATDELAPLEAQIRTATLAEIGREAADLARDPTLREIARRHSRDQFERDELSHASSDGSSPAQRVARGHRRLFGLVSENVAFQENVPVKPTRDLAARFVTGWMNSPGHRRNIEADYQVLEVGCYGTRQRQFCTQMFVNRMSYLEHPVPAEVGPGAALTLVLATSEGDATDAARRVSLAPEHVHPPDPSSSVALQVDARATLTTPERTGRYQLALWTATATTEPAQRFEIVPGPQLQVTTAAADGPDRSP